MYLLLINAATWPRRHAACQASQQPRGTCIALLTMTTFCILHVYVLPP
jgi:hypothetical protein